MIFSLFTLFWALCSPGMVSSVYADFSWPETVSYYADAADSSIRPQSELPDLSQSRFKLKKKKGILKPRLLPEGANAQDFFAINIETFNQASHSADFLGAKVDFYRKLEFNEKTQKHQRPHAYMDSWRTLFHPPIKKLEGAAHLIDQNLTPDFNPEVHESRYFDAGLQREVDRISDTSLTWGNQLELLKNGDSFQEKLRLIRESKKYFFGIVMVLHCDKSGDQLVEELVRARERGVDVKIIHEGLWTTLMNKQCVSRMRDAGINVLLISDVYRPRNFPGVMHNKFYVRDGEEAIIGGQNLMDSENLATSFNHRTRDSDVLIKSGPAVTDLMADYVDLWGKYGSRRKRKLIKKYELVIAEKKDAEARAGLRGDANYERWFSSRDTRMNGICRVVVQQKGQIKRIAPVNLKYIEAANDSIYATTPKLRYGGKKRFGHERYNTQMANALRKKGAEGLRIELISNGIDGGTGPVTQRVREFKSLAKTELGSEFNGFIVDAALGIMDRSDVRTNREAMLGLMTSPSIRTWTYFQYIHAKQILFDRTLTSIGSFNLEYFSSETNHEAQMFCLDQKLSQQMEESFALDLANSVPVTR